MPSPEDTAPPHLWGRRLRRLELFALAASAVFALQFHARLPGRLPQERSFAEVAEVLRAEQASGDVLLLFPWWTERARLFAPEGMPVVGYLGSDRDALTAHARIWVLAQPHLPGADGAAFTAAFASGRERLGEVRRFGNLELSLYRNTRHRPQLFSAAEQVAQARVYLESPSGRLDCHFDGRAHRCPGNLRVATEWHEVQFQPRRCLWMTPPGNASRLVLELPWVPSGSALTLEAGYIWDRGYFRSSRLTAAHFEVQSSGGVPVLDLSLPPGLEGVQRAEARLEQAGPVRLTLQSGNPELRELCVDLFAYGSVEAAAK